LYDANFVLTSTIGNIYRKSFIVDSDDLSIHQDDSLPPVRRVPFSRNRKPRADIDIDRSRYMCCAALMDAPLQRGMMEHLRLYGVDCNMLWIFTDQDRVGEHIGNQIFKCITSPLPTVREEADEEEREKDARYNANLQLNRDVFRASFTDMSRQTLDDQIKEMLKKRQRLDQALSNSREAQDVIDFRMGVGISTLLQAILYDTLPHCVGPESQGFDLAPPRRFEFLSNNLITYGPVFLNGVDLVVERFEEIQAFQRTPYWTVIAKNSKFQELEFIWEKHFMKKKKSALKLYRPLVYGCSNSIVPIAWEPNKETSEIRQRPQPLSLRLLCCEMVRYRRWPPEKTLNILTKLYGNGDVSYPRTDSTKYSEAFTSDRLEGYVSMFIKLKKLRSWKRMCPPVVGFLDGVGAMAAEILRNGGPNPRTDGVNKEDHEPIYPARLSWAKKVGSEISKMSEGKVLYDYICRHFMAQCSGDAQLKKIEMTCREGTNEMRFFSTSWSIKESGWLNSLHCPSLQGKLYSKTMRAVEDVKLVFEERETSPPNYLGEDDLLVQMDEHKIGTQATQVEALSKMEERRLITMSWQRGKGIILTKRVVTPTIHGIAMIRTLRRVAREREEYRLVGPEMRKQMWDNIVKVGEGKCTMEDVIREETLKYKNAHAFILRYKDKVKEVYARHFCPWFDKKPGGSRRSRVIEVGKRCGRCDKDTLQFGANCGILVCTECCIEVHIPPVGELLTSHGCNLITLKNARQKVRNKPQCKLCGYGLTVIPFGQLEATRKGHVVCPNCYTISLRNVQALEWSLNKHRVRKREYAPSTYEELKRLRFHEVEHEFLAPEEIQRPDYLHVPAQYNQQ